MEIKIKCEDEELILTNEGLNNPNYIEMYVKGSDALEPVMVDLKVLRAAVLAFFDIS